MKRGYCHRSMFTSQMIIHIIESILGLFVIMLQVLSYWEFSRLIAHVRLMIECTSAQKVRARKLILMNQRFLSFFNRSRNLESLKKRPYCFLSISIYCFVCLSIFLTKPKNILTQANRIALLESHIGDLQLIFSISFLTISLASLSIVPSGFVFYTKFFFMKQPFITQIYIHKSRASEIIIPIVKIFFVSLIQYFLLCRLFDAFFITK